MDGAANPSVPKCSFVPELFGPASRFTTAPLLPRPISCGSRAATVETIIERTRSKTILLLMPSPPQPIEFLFYIKLLKVNYIPLFKSPSKHGYQKFPFGLYLRFFCFLVK
jgi:hypothetical protein